VYQMVPSDVLLLYCCCYSTGKVAVSPLWIHFLSVRGHWEFSRGVVVGTSRDLKIQEMWTAWGIDMWWCVPGGVGFRPASPHKRHSGRPGRYGKSPVDVPFHRHSTQAWQGPAVCCVYL